MHQVFVYGTLKTDEPNHHWLTIKINGHSKYLGKATTIEKYPLIISTKYNIPFLLYTPGEGNIVEGEVYEVDEKMLLKLDELEDHPNFYIREIYTVKLYKNDGTEVNVECWIYFLKTFNRVLLKNPTFPCYSSNGDHGLPYIDRSQRNHNHLSQWKTNENISTIADLDI